MAGLFNFRYPVSPLEALVLLHNVLHCKDAENDADRTVEEIIQEIDGMDGYLSKGVLESGLYCCTMQQENNKFWHPQGWTYDRFLKELLPKSKSYNRFYNVIFDKEEADGSNAKTRR